MSERLEPQLLPPLLPRESRLLDSPAEVEGREAEVAHLLLLRSFKQQRDTAQGKPAAHGMQGGASVMSEEDETRIRQVEWQVAPFDTAFATDVRWLVSMVRRLFEQLETGRQLYSALLDELDILRVELTVKTRALEVLGLQSTADGDPVTFTWEELKAYRDALNWKPKP